MNRDRKKRKRVNENIEQKEWKNYFMRLLGRVEHRVVGGDGERNCEGRGIKQGGNKGGGQRSLKDEKAAGWKRRSRACVCVCVREGGGARCLTKGANRS